jgi:hypothetical protein
MIEVLSKQVWTWNIEKSWNHFNKGSGVRERIVQGMNQTGA